MVFLSREPRSFLSFATMISLLPVGGDDLPNQAQVDPIAFPHPDEGSCVLGKATSPKAWSRVQELRAYTSIHSQGFRYSVDVCSYGITEIGSLVNESHLHSQESVIRVFDEFNSFKVTKGKRNSQKIQWPVDLLHKLPSPHVLSTYNYLV